MYLFLILIQAAVAIITAPVPGDTVLGIINIRGTAASPEFARYEIAFAYDPNPTDTWFEIQPASTSQVTEGPLAVWDTTGITDGNYMIRLRVFSSGSNTPVETILRNIQVRNTAPTGTAVQPLPSPPGPGLDAPTTQPSSTPTLALLDTTATPLPSPSATIAATSASPPAAVPPFLDLSTYSSAFCNGVYLSLAAFVLLGIYVALRDRIRRLVRRWIRRVMSDIRKP